MKQTKSWRNDCLFLTLLFSFHGSIVSAFHASQRIVPAQQSVLSFPTSSFGVVGNKYHPSLSQERTTTTTISPTFLLRAYLGDGKEVFAEANSYLDTSYLDSSSSSSTIISSSEDFKGGFIPFENPQQIWPLQALEEPSLTTGRLLVVAAAAIYGTNFASVKMLNEIMPTGVSAVARFGLAALAVTALVLQGEQSTASTLTPEMKQERHQATLLGMEIGGWYSIGYLAQAAGLMTVDASKSAFFNALAVVVVPLLDSFFKGKKINKTMMGAISLAIAGVGLLQLGPSSTEALAQHTAYAGVTDGGGFSISTGDMLSFVQALLFGVGYWRLENAASKYSNQASRITMGQLLGVAAGSVLYCVGNGQIPDISSVTEWVTDPFVLKAIAWTGLASTALALYLETVALKVVSATELTVLMTSVSVWGSAFAFLTMGEVLPPIGMAGGALIMSSCVLSATSSTPTSTVLLPEQEKEEPWVETTAELNPSPALEFETLPDN